MTDKMRLWIILALMGCALQMIVSCGGNRRVEPEQILRFDRSIVDYPTLDSASRQAFRDSFQVVADVMSLISTRGASAHACDSFLSAYATDDKMLYYVPAIEERLGRLDSVERSLGMARDNIASRFPEVHWPRLYGVVLTYNQSVVLADSIALVGLNHYLGPDYEPYGYFDAYRRYAKQKRFLPYNVVEALLASAYPYRPSADATALNRMAYEGALVEAVMSVLESDDESSALGYSPGQLAWAEDNEKNVWRTMIERDLVYSTDPAVAERLVAPAPQTSIVHPAAPGRIGRFVGHRIVRSYMNRNKTAGAASLLDSAFYNSADVLIKSDYVP